MEAQKNISNRLSPPIIKSPNILRMTSTSPPHKKTTNQDSQTLFDNTYKSKELRQDRNMVFELNNWEKRITKFTAIHIIKEAKLELERRLNHENVVEDIINSRKKNLRTTSSSPTSRSSFKEEFSRYKEISFCHKQYEDQLIKGHSAFKLKLENILNQRQELRSELSDLRDELKETQEDLENCKFNLEKLEKNKKILKQKGEAAKYFTRKTTFRDEIFKKESRCAEITQELGTEIRKNGKILESLDIESSHLREELEIIKSAIIEHYKKLLVEGKDSRSEGLTWIVQKLWEFDEKLEPSDFASYLDQDSIKCILLLTEKNSELEKLVEKISSKNSEKSKIFSKSRDKLNEIHSRLAEASRSIRMKRAEVQFVDTHKSSVTWENCSYLPSQVSTMNTSQVLIELQQQISGLRTSIKEIKELEIARLFKLCFISNYDSKKKTSLKTLISAIVGYENLDKYSSLIIKLKRDVLEKVSSTKTFRFFPEPS